VSDSRLEAGLRTTAGFRQGTSLLVQLRAITAHEVPANQEDEIMPYAKFSPEEVASRGEEMYDRQLRENVETGNKGKFIIIDIETGQYEIDEDDLQATKRALAKRGGAVLYGLRIGYPTAYTLGGHIGTEVP
jgi:hypothetical protein